MEIRNRRFLSVLLLAIAIVFIIVVMMENRIARQLIYPVPSFSISAPPSGMQRVQLTTPDGLEIEGWLYDQAGDAVLLYFHGNGENLETVRLSGLFEELSNLNIPFFAIDYPGYGNSSGIPSESTILSASKEAIEYLSQRYSKQKLVSCGWSLGAAVALRSAAENPKQVHAVIAMSAWTSLSEVGALHYPGWLVRWLVQERYDSLEACRKLKCPVLLLHGEEDDLIPVSHGEKLAWQISSQVRWIKVPDASHNDLLGRAIVWNEIANFLNSLSGTGGH
jgi:pimeloyl-ACP methyl ester carboxylesterase